MSEQLSNRLPVLALEIRKAHDDVRRAAQTTVEHATRAGEALLEAKALVKHGEWLPWLRDNCKISERSARVYMHLARIKDEIGKSGSAADLSIRAALAIAKVEAEDGLIVEPETMAQWLQLKLWQIHPGIMLHPCRMEIPDDLTFEQWEAGLKLLQQGLPLGEA